MSVQDFEYSRSSSRVKVVGDEGLKAYTRRVFLYMMTSLGITAVVSYIILRTPLMQLFLSVNPKTNTLGYTGLGTLTMLAPLGIMLFMNFKQSMSARATKICLYTISAMEGASVSLLLLFAGVHTAFQAFLITGILFGSMSLYGYLTNRDLLGLGSFLTMALWGMVIVSLISLFFGGVGIWFSYLTVLVFTGLIAYDAQKIKQIYSQIGGYGEFSDKVAVYCALSLYLDFLNVFMALIRILGANRDN